MLGENNLASWSRLRFLPPHPTLTVGLTQSFPLRQFNFFAFSMCALRIPVIFLIVKFGYIWFTCWKSKTIPWCWIAFPIASSGRSYEKRSTSLYDTAIYKTKIIVEAFQKKGDVKLSDKSLRAIAGVQWYISYHTLHTDLNIILVKEECRARVHKYYDRLQRNKQTSIRSDHYWHYKKT